MKNWRRQNYSNGSKSWRYDTDKGIGHEVECDADGWIKPSDLIPDYTTRAGSDSFACIQISLNGIVSDGLYCNGEWQMLGGVKVKNVDGWQPQPNPMKIIHEI